MRDLKDPGHALALALVIMGGILLVGNIATLTWSYHDDGRCDACGGGVSHYVVVYEIGGIPPEKISEFCGDHAFIWGFFHPWVPAEGLFGLNLISLIALFAIIYGCSSLGFLIRRKLSGYRKWSILLSATFVFTLGAGLLIGGFYSAAAEEDRWEPQSKVLANDEPLEVPGWEAKSENLVENESLLASPKFESREETLVDGVLSVPTWRTYDYDLGHIFCEAASFELFGQITEISQPQREFNFYILDQLNFDLWTANEAYTAYYEVAGVGSLSFNFSFTEEGYSHLFYFVVEESVLDVKPEVDVTVTIEWIHTNSFLFYTNTYTCDKHWALGSMYTDIVVTGSATEGNGSKFDFYVMDWYNYFNFENTGIYSALYEARNISEIEFIIPFTSTAAFQSSLCFVVENSNLNVNEIVRFSARISWNEKTSGDRYFECSVSPERGNEQIKDLTLRGTLEEENAHVFNFYICDSTVYFNWKDNTRYEDLNVTATSFNISFTEYETKAMCFVAENQLVNVDETVRISLTLEYQTLTTIKRNVYAIAAFLGGLITVVAGPSVALIFSHSEKLNELIR